MEQWQSTRLDIEIQGKVIKGILQKENLQRSLLSKVLLHKEILPASNKCAL
jgi:hypothetical protein